MSKNVACTIMCQCGGTACQTLAENEGAWYILTDDHFIVFQGLCSDCGEVVSVRREITTLYMMCPNSETRGLAN